MKKRPDIESGPGVLDVADSSLVVSVLASTMLVLCSQVRMPMSVAHLITSEILNPARRTMLVEVLAAARILTMPSVVAVVAVIHVTPETFAPVIPRSRSDK